MDTRRMNAWIKAGKKSIWKTIKYKGRKENRLFQWLEEGGKEEEINMFEVIPYVFDSRRTLSSLRKRLR